jgi:hypothetical protein
MKNSPLVHDGGFNSSQREEKSRPFSQAQQFQTNNSLILLPNTKHNYTLHFINDKIPDFLSSAVANGCLYDCSPKLSIARVFNEKKEVLMNKKVLMRKNRKKLNTIQLLSKRLNHTLQLPENLDDYSVKNLEVAEKEYLEDIKNNRTETRSKEIENLESYSRKF